MLSLSSRIIKQNKKLSKARLRSCVKFIPRPTGAIPGGGILGEAYALAAFLSPNRTTGGVECTVWTDEPEEQSGVLTSAHY